MSWYLNLWIQPYISLHSWASVFFLSQFKLGFIPCRQKVLVSVLQPFFFSFFNFHPPKKTFWTIFLSACFPHHEILVHTYIPYLFMHCRYICALYIKERWISLLPRTNCCLLRVISSLLRLHDLNKFRRPSKMLPCGVAG